MTNESSMNQIITDNNTTHNFFILLSGAVCDNAPSDLISPIDWEKILKLAQYHNVYSLVFEQASKYPEFANSSYFDKHMIKATKQVAYQSKWTYEFLKLYCSFAENGLFPIVVKGIVCRQLYGRLCDHRPSGDEDILVKKEDYLTAKSILESSGYSADFESITADQLNELQEVTFYNSSTKLKIELHVNLMGKGNDLRRNMNDCFTDVFDSCIETEISGVKIRTMNHTKHFLYLILHAFLHFIVSGLGIRQLLDILLYNQQYNDAIDFEYIVDTLRKFDALCFYSDMIHIGNMYLGFNLAAPCESYCPEELIDDIIKCGAFGNTTQSQRTAQQMTNAAVANQKSNRRMRTFLRTVFPSRKQMMNKHPELQKKPWLLPIRWIQRIGRFICHSKDNSSLAKESMQISKTRLELLKKYNII
ncbi:MAG: nucleotidyltransferase family protein [Monoglobaceae bacterium]